MARKKRKSPRGWLLVEVAVGGVMASVILGALLVNIGGAHDRTTIISRQMTARMLAEQGIEQIRTKGLAGTSSDVAPVPSTLTGTYTRTCTTTSSSTTINSLTLGNLDISCTVTFPVNADGKGTTGLKSVTLSTQITEPPPP